MLDEVATRKHGTPEWWLLRLGRKLAAEQPRFDRLESYWRGNPPLPAGNQRMREAYRRLQRLARTNFGALIAESVLERMKVIGFKASGSADEEADEEAWRWWQANGLDADSGLLHRAMVVLSRAYVIVGEDPDEDDQPLITVEDPRQVIHESHPTDRRKVAAALKTYWDDIADHQAAVLYLPGKVHYYRTAGVKQDTGGSELWKAQRWEPDDSGGAAVIDGPLPTEVPVTPFVNRPDMAGNGLGEFEDVLDILDRINTVILDRLVISAMQAYRQRWAKGVKLTDENGNDTAAFDPGADLLWAVEDELAQFGEFAPTDLTPIVKAIESDVQYLSAISRTPPHYILAGIVNASGDALSVAETGLTSKVVEREMEAGESWERVYRHAGAIRGRVISRQAEVLWRDPQFRSLTEMASASVQLKGADVPWATRMRKLDMTPQDIARMEAERMQDAMTAALMQPMLAPGVGATGQGQPGLPTPAQPGPTGNAAGGLSEPTRPTESRRPNAGRARNGGGGRDGGTSGTAIGSDAAWDVLYQRAKAAGIRGASKMTKAQLRALLGG